MFQHQRNIRIQPSEFFNVSTVVDLTASGSYLLKPYVVLHNPFQILAVTGNDPWPELLEAFADEGRALIEPPWRVDSITHIEMNCKRFSAHRLDQLQVGVGTIRKVPPHHLDCETG